MITLLLKDILKLVVPKGSLIFRRSRLFVNIVNRPLIMSLNRREQSRLIYMSS